MSDIKVCPKCKGEMEEGVLINRNTALVQALHQPVEWGNNFRYSTLGNPKIDNETQVTTYKCKNCGFLESYGK